MKCLLSIILVVLFVFLTVTSAAADETVNTDLEGAETIGRDDEWDIPIDIEYEENGIEEVEEDADENEEGEETNPFVGEWLCENASIFIDEEDGTFYVYIMWDINDSEEDIWEYICTIDAEASVLTGEGKKNHEVIDEEGEVVSDEEIYTDGSATFTLEDDALIWADTKEDMAHEMRFEHFEEDFLEGYAEDDETEDSETEDYETEG